MTIDYGFDNIPKNLRTVVTIGSFDGVHRGHRVLLSALKSMAKRLNAESVVVTFDPHPRIAMGRDEGMGLLTTIQERAYLLHKEGVDRMVVAHFDDTLRQQPYELFVRESLVAQLGMVGMVVGYNHRLGRGSEGNYATLQPLAADCGFEIERVSQHLVGGAKVSSTVVRDIITQGDMLKLRQMLGERYLIMGEAHDGVVQISDRYKLLPKSNEYDAEVESNGLIYNTTIKVDNRRIEILQPITGRVIIRV
ncbi:MAG: FAD synthetase [Alistipes sp.]|nr:FAD synthetase [Alistipes sp.]